MKLKYLLLLCVIYSSCNNKQQNNLDKKKIDTMNDSQETLYFLDYKLFASFEIYLNDVKITNNIESGTVDGMEYLNEYILKTGVQKLKIREFLVNTKTPIPEDLVKRVKLAIYTTDKNEENIKKIKEFKIPLEKSPKPYAYEFEFEFEAEVPYKLEGWTRGKDLTKQDQKELRKKVESKFEELKELLNKGNVNKFLALNEKGFEEFKVANYYNAKKWNEYKENIVEGLLEQKGVVEGVKNHKMIIGGNGKLVTLERVDKNYRGESPLMAINKDEETIYLNYLFFYMPEDSEELKPIRLRIDYDDLDQYE